MNISQTSASQMTWPCAQKQKIYNMESQLNKLNTESNKIGLKIHRGKTKFMTNYESDKEVQIANEKIEKVTKYKYLGQNTVVENKTK